VHQRLLQRGDPDPAVRSGHLGGFAYGAPWQARPGLISSRSVSNQAEPDEEESATEVRVRRIHRRDLNRTWEFLKLVFRDVNRETVEYQRPRSKHRFQDVYDDDEAEQLLFEVDGEIVGYAECTLEISGSDNWLNPRYFDKRNMRPMFLDELAVHPKMQGRGVGGFMIEQLQHLARLRGCTHLVLEVAENNRDALLFYRKRNFQKLDAAIFMAQKIASEPDLLPPRVLNALREEGEPDEATDEPVAVRALPEPSEAETRKGGTAREPNKLRFRAKTAAKELARPKRKSTKKRPSGDDEN
jgi:ribosomal protein S18 acetylase RimI-like enzyme